MPTFETTKGWNGYLDWAGELVGLNKKPAELWPERLRVQGIDEEGDLQPDELWEPIFVRSRDPDVSTQTFFDSVNSTDGLAFDLFEQKFNEHLREPGEPVEAFLYRQRDCIGLDGNLDALVEVLMTGALVTGKGVPASSPKPLEVFGRSEVVLGIIDDGIAFLNSRFRTSPEHTRFIAIWNQTPARMTGAPEGGIRIGEVLEHSQLNDDLKDLNRKSEDEIYRQYAADLYSPDTNHSMRNRATHGTMMLDLAAGKDPGDVSDGITEVPILAVQLPPQAYDDTSGQRLQTHILQGIRWLIYQTIVGDLAPRLIINMSLGVIAGAKDGSSFIEQQVARELGRATTASGGQVSVDLVVPFGNGYDDQLVAYAELGPGGSTNVTLQVQPDDPTPGFVEIRLTPDSNVIDPEMLEITIKPPGGAFHKAQVPPGQHLNIKNLKDTPVARLFHTPARMIWNGRTERAYLTLAVAPTRKDFPYDRAAQSGAWEISVRNRATGEAKVSLQVQRDDSPFPRNTGARQAYMETPGIYEWNIGRRDFSELGKDTPLTRAGTNSAYTTIPSNKVHRVGAARVRDTNIRPAEYSAKSADWSGGEPDASAISENAILPSGILGSGTFSSATARLNGTSAAAASYSRNLCREALGENGLPSQPALEDQDRLGQVVIIDNPAIRRR